jgi:ParB family chromosome partitioning protein
VREAEALARKLSAEFNLTASKRAAGRQVARRAPVEESCPTCCWPRSRCASQGRPPHRRQRPGGRAGDQFASLDELNGLIERLRGS